VKLGSCARKAWRTASVVPANTVTVGPPPGPAARRDEDPAGKPDVVGEEDVDQRAVDAAEDADASGRAEQSASRATNSGRHRPASGLLLDASLCWLDHDDALAQRPDLPACDGEPRENDPGKV
jgi:hypothetical protein